MQATKCAECEQVPTNRFSITICGHIFCNTCINARVPDSSTKYRCPVCYTKLKREKFYHTGYDELDSMKMNEEIVYKVYDHSRDDFDSVQNYNMFIEDRDVIVYNLTNNIDTHNQRRKLKEHKELKKKLGIPSKKKKIEPEADRLPKRKNKIEDFKRIRKRMAKRETLTFERLRGTLSAEACQQQGHQIEEEDFKAAQKERVVILKRDKTAQLAPAYPDYIPAKDVAGTIEAVVPQPLDKELAEKNYCNNKGWSYG